MFGLNKKIKELEGKVKSLEEIVDELSRRTSLPPKGLDRRLLAMPREHLEAVVGNLVGIRKSLDVEISDVAGGNVDGDTNGTN